MSVINAKCDKNKLYSLVSLALLLALLMPILSTSVYATPTYTEVGGLINSDTTWTLANSPYVVTSNVQVMNGVTLTIQAGVAVKFNTGNLLQIDGTLIARGTAAQPITFTSNQSAPQPSDWANIYFSDSSVDATYDANGNYQSGSVLQYCVVEWGGNNATSAIHAPYAAPFIDHCAIRNNACRGIHVGDPSEGTDAARAVISNNTILSNSSQYNGGGIYAVNGLVMSNTMIGNSTNGYGGGIYTEYSTVSYNTATNNSAYYGGGIYATWYTTVDYNTVSGNSAYRAGGIDASGSTTACTNTITYNSASAQAGGIRAEFYTTVCNNWIAHNSAGSYGGGVYGTWCTVRDNIVTDNSSVSGGGIYVDYGDVKNNVVSQNVANNAGGGIYAALGSGTFLTRVMSNTVVRNSASNQGAGVYSAASVFNNTIIGNVTISPTALSGGLAVDGAQTHDNNLYGNSNYDAVAISPYYDISGTYNYWGTVVDTTISAHIYDRYDSPSYHTFLYVPYLQDLSSMAPVPPPLNLSTEVANSSVVLSWDAIPSTTTGYRYKVYYDTDASGPPYNGTGATQGNSPIDVGNVTSYTLSGLGNSTYYIAVTTYDNQGRESWYSNQVNSLRRVYLPVVLRN